jgi:NADPH:quinone reductase
VRALVCHAFAPVDELMVADLPEPHLEPGHVLIDVAAAGLNFPDVLCVQGLYQFKPPLPFAPGQEGAGTIRAVGEGVTHLKAGDRAAFIVLSGAIAEAALAPASLCIKLPDAVDLQTAAGFGMVYGTSYYALKQRAALKEGQTLLVLGAAGGVGLAAVELGKAMGARVIAAASTPQKRQIAMDAGAEASVDYTDPSWREALKNLTDGKGVDVVYDPVGGEIAEAALRSIAWEGRYLVVGFAAGTIPKIPLNLPLLKGCSVMGVFWGAWAIGDPEASRANFVELYDMLAAGKLKPLISRTLPLDQAKDGLLALGERRATGKIVVTIGA